MYAGILIVILAAAAILGIFVAVAVRCPECNSRNISTLKGEPAMLFCNRCGRKFHRENSL